MLEDIKKRVYEAHMSLIKHNLVNVTWGNASQIDRKTGYMVIKPTKVKYEDLKPEYMVVVDLQGNVIEGDFSPSSDTNTHIELYRRYPSIGGIVHTHSKWATVFAQAGRSIPALGTTHADTFFGDIPCTRRMKKIEIFGDLEEKNGKAISECFTKDKIMKIPGALVHSHGPFTWGANVEEAVNNSVILEDVAMMAWHTMMLAPDIKFQSEYIDKHYHRKY